MSKFLYGVKAEQVPSRNKEFLDKFGIDVKLQSKVETIDYTNRELKLDNGEKVHYNKLLIATGGDARRPKVDGVNFNNVFVLRKASDALKLQEETKKAKNIVIVGSSFIGLEAASALKKELKEGANVTVVSAERVPFELLFGR
jgi:NAD(P)H-nitrite reductase large subunit